MKVFEMLMRACGVALLSAICLVFLPRISAGYGSVIRVAGGVFLFGCFLSMLREGISEILPLTSFVGDDSPAAEAFSLMLKALGIALVARFCADVCRDCGENTLACGVESVGRMAIFLLSVPMIVRILSLAADMLGMGG